MEIAELDERALSPVAPPEVRPTSPLPVGRGQRLGGAHRPWAAAPAHHANGSGHGEIGGASADPDRIYRELLRRLREEREQLGLVVDEPF